MGESTLEIITDPPNEVASTACIEAAHAIHGIAQVLATDQGAALPPTRLVAASDIHAAIQRERERLGLPPDPRDGPERVGGSVGGRCLYEADSDHATVVVPLVAATAVDAEMQLLGGEIVAHEFMHLVYTAAKATEVEQLELTLKPWDIARAIAITAAEEFRVSRMGDLIAQGIFNPTDSDGKELLVANRSGQGYRDGLSDALDALLPDVAAEIWRYRLTGTPIEDLWNAVWTTTHGVAVYLSYMEARSLDGRLAIQDSDHPAAGLLEPVWRPLMTYLRDSALLPQPGGWTDDQASLAEIGHLGFLEVWRRLGLESHPLEDTFYLSVGDPDEDYAIALIEGTES